MKKRKYKYPIPEGDLKGREFNGWIVNFDADGRRELARIWSIMCSGCGRKKRTLRTTLPVIKRCRCFDLKSPHLRAVGYEHLSNHHTDIIVECNCGRRTIFPVNAYLKNRIWCGLQCGFRREKEKTKGVSHEVRELLKQGKSAISIARQLGLSRQRVHQIKAVMAAEVDLPSPPARSGRSSGGRFVTGHQEGSLRVSPFPEDAALEREPPEPFVPKENRKEVGDEGQTGDHKEDW